MGNCCQPNLKHEKDSYKLNSLNILAETHIIQDLKNLKETKLISPYNLQNLEKTPPEQIKSQITSHLSLHAPPPSLASKATLPPLLTTTLINPCIDLPPFKFSPSPKNPSNTKKIILGPYKYKKGEIYIGQYKKSKREGKGTQLWPDGSYYEGNFKNDKTHGFGRLVHNEGDVYEGEWEEGHACGIGVFYHRNGVVFEGGWRDDTQDGQGMEKWDDGVMYKGGYLKGRKHGKGEFVWKSGDRYFGEFRDDNIEGYGEYFWNDGRSYKGEWKNNKMNGDGEFVSRNLKRFVGSFLNDKKHGRGYYIYTDGREKHGEWDRGKLLLNKKNDEDGISDDDNFDHINPDSMREKNNSNSFTINEEKKY